jgi:hypothetical protein
MPDRMFSRYDHQVERPPASDPNRFRASGMTSGGKRIAFFLGIAIALALPKRVDCGYPGADCKQIGGGKTCATYEVEPLGFYLIEYVVGRNVGFAYSSGDDCH